MKARDQRLQYLRRQIAEVTAQQAHALVQCGTVLVDIRGPEETGQGVAAGAHLIDRGHLELCIEELAPDPAQTLVIMCGAGVRSLFAADALRQMGYADVRSLAGGFNAWKDAGLPFHIPELADLRARARYSRQLILPQVGVQGQEKFRQARVLILGAGGLGSPAALYLAAAGVGTLGLVDHDRVDRSNLNRQVIHADARVGQPKVESARLGINALNPDVAVHAHDVHLLARRRQQARDLFAGYDLVIDGSDNFAAHYLANDVCTDLGLPCVHGSVFRFDAQVGVFWPAGPHGGPCYRCLYPAPPPPELAPSCNEAGVLGVVPGLVGLIQATEALKLILGAGEPLIGRLLCLDALQMQFHELRIRADANCNHGHLDVPAKFREETLHA